MSILVNARGGKDSTIVRFGQFFASSSYYAREYVSINNRCFTVPNTTSTLKWRYTYGSGECDMVMIRAEIMEDAEGYIYGFKASGAEMSIQMFTDTQDNNKKKIKWTIGSNSRTVEWQAGVHVYGFTSNGLGFYDGTKLGKGSSSITSLIDSGASGSLDQQIIIGGLIDGTASNAKDCIHTTGSGYSINIYEVVLSAYNESSTSRTIAHLYACSDGTSGSLYETRYHRGVATQSNGKSYTGVTVRTTTPSTTITYGVQLHDLKFITSSGYRDLIALMCEDWPEQASADADPAYTLTNSSESKEFKSAFMLKGNNPNTHVSTNMPIPTGWSHESTSPSRPKTQATILGDLIFGRTPKWNLWADNINVGKYTIMDDGQMYFAYNIFMPRNGQQKPNLEQFEGYSTGASAHHDPFLDMGGDLTIEYHNAVACRADGTTLIPASSVGFDSSGNSFGPVSSKDNMRVFEHQLPPLGDDVKMGLGNLIDWHKTAAQQIADDDDTHNLKYYFTGISASVYRTVPGAAGAKRLIGAAWEQTATLRSGTNYLQPLSSDTTTAERNKFRDGKNSDGTAYYNWQINMCGDEKDQDLLYYETREGPTQGLATLSAIMDIVAKNKEQGLQSGNLCNADYVLPVLSPTFNRNVNPKMDNNALDYRAILMKDTVSISSSTKYIYPLFTWGNSTEIMVRTRNIENTYSGFVFLFCIVNKALSESNNGAVDLSQMSFKLSLELVTVKSDDTVIRSFMERDFESGAVDAAFAPGSTPQYFYEANALDGNSFISHMTGQNNSVNKLCKSVHIPIADIKTVNPDHVSQYQDEGNRDVIARNTTCRLWVEKSDAVAPKIRIRNAQYSWQTAEFLQPFSGSGTSIQALSIDRTPLLKLNSKTDPVRISLRTLPTAALDIQTDTGAANRYGMRIVVFRNWPDTDIGGRDVVCQFMIFKEGTASQTPRLSYQGYGSNGDDWSDGGYVLYIESAGTSYMDFRITPENPYDWGNNNLEVWISRTNSFIS